jgi:hypothetical protein
MCDQYVQRTRGRRLRDGAGCGTHRQRDGQDVQLGRGRGTTDDARFGGEQGLAKYELKDTKQCPIGRICLLFTTPSRFFSSRRIFNIALNFAVTTHRYRLIRSSHQMTLTRMQMTYQVAMEEDVAAGDGQGKR